MGFTTSALLALALQQGFTTPPGGDTIGYWQQRVSYRISAHLDEQAQRIRATGTMRYVNNSPDTLRELYVHQYLNAFRPGSKWSDADTREGRVRFQNLRDPDHGYERFTAPVQVNGVATTVTYPGAPDSTVARIALAAPLRPGDDVEVRFEWEARPSTLPRRQGRRGRHWDLAQWYPRIAVYDRGGWQAKALEPAGEFYGEFGDYDVTLILARDQVVAATGVPVSGDPGWRGARRHGTVHDASGAYAPGVWVETGGDDAETGATDVRRVRFVARNVHHFAWSASPQYRYEGGVYVRTPPPGRVRAWDTVAIHVLYQPGDDTTWGGGRVVQRTINTLGWLESIFGRYAYPQMTVLHRIEGGGTEFPMMQMNGSPSQGLNLHEGGHVWLHGILANNEWGSGWLDEGFTSYQSEWAQGLTPQERLRAGVVDRFGQAAGYRGRALAPALSRFDAIGLQMTMMDLEGDAQPLGLAAHEFRDFGTYNQMIYTRAQVMYGQLRDALGDSAWTAALQDYYERWALKHVDERALRGSVERASGKDFSWFFEQWVRHTGLMDYALADVRQERAGASWVTVATVERRGAYAHPIMVGARTASGWTTARIADPLGRVQDVRITTSGEPLEVRIDPHHFSWDWNRRNDTDDGSTRWNFDWPFLRQADRDRSVALVRPLLWYGDPAGLTPAVRVRTSYLDFIDRTEFGAAYSTGDIEPLRALQGWLRVENPYLPFFSRPLMGWGASVGKLDDVLMADGSHVSEFRGRRSGWFGGRITYSEGLEGILRPLLPEQWSSRPVVDYALDVHPRWRRGSAEVFVDAQGVLGVHRGLFTKAQLAVGMIRAIGRGNQLRVRAFGGTVSDNVPGQRALLLSSQDAVTTYRHHWWRPRMSLLKQEGVNGLPLGGAGLRALDWRVASNSVLASNLDLSRVLGRAREPAAPTWRLHAFVDAATAGAVVARPLSDAGLALSVRGQLFDRAIALRLDVPLYVSHPALARDARPGDRHAGFRYTLSFTDIWPD
jgi:hypothetical protein